MNDKALTYVFTPLAVAAGAALVVLFLFDPATHGFYPQCALHRVTGLYCPGCGILRAIHELLHGHFVRAFTLNPLFVLSVPVILAYVSYSLLKRVKGGEVRGVPSIRWVWMAAVLIVCFGVVRNLPYSTLAWMRP